MGGKWNLSYLFGIGSISAGIFYAMIGVSEIAGFFNRYLVLAFMCLNGIA
jgi:hypothetical protein